MSRVILSNDTRTVHAELIHDDVDGNWSAACESGDWVSEPGRWYDLRDLAEEAGLHVDRAHR